MGLSTIYIICGFELDDEEIKKLAGKKWGEQLNGIYEECEEDLLMECEDVIFNNDILKNSFLGVYKLPHCYESKKGGWIFGKKIREVELRENLVPTECSEFVGNESKIQKEMKKLKLEYKGVLKYYFVPSDCYCCS